jgi:hypothetical protein
MEQSVATDRPDSRRACSVKGSLWVLWWSLGAGAMTIGSSLLLKQEGPALVKGIYALLPAPLFAMMFYQMVRVVRRMDELQVRIHFEALAMAFIGTGLICLAYGQLQKAKIVPLAELSSAWVVMAFTYVACYALSHWRYTR